MTNTITFEWDGTPDTAVVAVLLDTFETRGEVGRVRLEIDAEDIEISDAVVGALAEERPLERSTASSGGGLDSSTKAYWAAVAVYASGNEWTTVKELAALLGEETSASNAQAYFKTLQRNDVVEVRTRQTGGRGANPKEYRLTEDGIDTIESEWTNASSPPERFPDDLTLGEQATGDA